MASVIIRIRDVFKSLNPYHQKEIKMTKAELVAKMAESAGITKVQAEKALATFTCAVSCALREKDKVTLVGFGTFSALKRAARTGRNPQTGKPLKIAAKTVGKFTPGKDLKDLSKKPSCQIKTTPKKVAAKPTKKK
jgi:nucleoid DNA-binding protein